MKKLQRKAVQREEVAPTFPALKQRLEEKEQAFRHEIEQFFETLKVLGTPMIEEPAVHFVYYNPTAQSVAVSGEFNQWTATPMTPLGQTGIFYHTAEFRGPVRVEYKLIVDGQWLVDPCCPNRVDNGIGEQNSFSFKILRSSLLSVRLLLEPREGSYVSSQASSAPPAPGFPATCSLLQFSAVKSRSKLAACSCTRTSKHGLCLAACAETAVFEAVGILWSDWGKPERIVEVLRAPGSNLSFQCLSFS